MLGQLAPRRVGMGACAAGETTLPDGSCLPAVPNVNVNAKAVVSVATNAPANIAAARKTVDDIQTSGKSGAQAAYNTLQTSTQTVTNLVNSAPGDVKAKATDAVNGLSNEGKAIWDAYNSPQANANRIYVGTVAMQQLSNDKNPFQTSDGRDKLVHVTSGALSCTVILAPMAAILELANLLVHGLNAIFGFHDPSFEDEWPTPTKPVTGGDLAGGSFGSNPYAGWLRDEILGVPPILDLGKSGSFRHAVLPVLLQMYADAVNGKTSALTHPDTAVAAVATLWNQIAAGPMINYYVPMLRPDIVSEQRAYFNENHILMSWLSGQLVGNASGPLQKMSQTTWSLWDPLAFLPVDEAYRVYTTDPFGPGKGTGGYSADQLAAILTQRRNQGLWSTLAARSGPLKPPIATTIAKIAVPAVAVAPFAYAWLTGKSVESVLSSAWRSTLSILR